MRVIGRRRSWDWTRTARRINDHLFRGRMKQRPNCETDEGVRVQRERWRMIARGCSIIRAGWGGCQARVHIEVKTTGTPWSRRWTSRNRDRTDPDLLKTTPNPESTISTSAWTPNLPTSPHHKTTHPPNTKTPDKADPPTTPTWTLAPPRAEDQKVPACTRRSGGRATRAAGAGSYEVMMLRVWRGGRRRVIGRMILLMGRNWSMFMR